MPLSENSIGVFVNGAHETPNPAREPTLVRLQKCDDANVVISQQIGELYRLDIEFAIIVNPVSGSCPPDEKWLERYSQSHTWRTRWID